MYGMPPAFSGPGPLRSPGTGSSLLPPPEPPGRQSPLPPSHEPMPQRPRSSPPPHPHHPLTGRIAGPPTAFNRLSSRFEVQASKKDGGSSVIDRPTIDSDTLKKNLFSSQKPPIYRVLLHNDDFNRREYVVQILLKVVEGMTVDDAVNVMNEAHESGLALVGVYGQEVAETYCESLRGAGLICTIEPEGKGPAGPGDFNNN